MKENNNYFLITGASKGIGKSCLELLLKNNCKVIAIARNKKNLTKIIKNKNEGGGWAALIFYKTWVRGACTEVPNRQTCFAKFKILVIVSL